MSTIEPAPPSASSAGKNLALIGLVVAVVGFALTAIFVRLSEIGPIATGFWRALLAAPLLFAMQGFAMSRQGHTPVSVRVRDYAWLMFTSCAMAADLIFFQSAVHHTSIANATLIGGLFPIVATLGAWLLFDERITPIFLVGLVIALAGTALLVYAGGTPLEPVALGDYLAVGSVFSFSFYVIGLKQLRGRFSTSTVMSWNLGVSACVLLPIAIAMGESLLPPSLYGWMVLIGFAVIVDVISRTAYTYSFARLTASFNAVGLLAAPGLAAAIAWILFGESLSILQIAAAITALGGVALAQQGQR